MTISRHFSGGPFEERLAYCRALEVDGWVLVSGCTGSDPVTKEMPEDVVAQCRNALATIKTALEAFGTGFEDVVRVHYILPNGADFEACWPVLREAFGANPPTATMFAAGLISPAMKIEIEVTARKP